jgi:GAF domain-containing protein
LRYARRPSARAQLSRRSRDFADGRRHRRTIFGHGKPGVFSERSEWGLSGLAAEAAVAIDNVRLSQASQREIAERKRAQEALVELNASLEKQVLERTEQLRRNEEALRQSKRWKPWDS